MNRREFVSLGALAAAGRLGARAGQPPSPAGLKALAAPCGRRIGVWLNRSMLDSSAFAEAVGTDFNHAMIGTIKRDFLERVPGRLDFSLTDRLVAFSRANGMTMHGHNLCWNATSPAWLPGRLAAGGAEKNLTDFITAVMTRYRGVIGSYDVVNEPIAIWKGRPDGLYTGPWLSALGPEYIDIAFHAAREADPAALRVLNTAHVEQKGDDRARAATLALVENLLKRKVPVQAIGMESHLNGGVDAGPDADRERFLAALRGMGLKVLITELDVNDAAIAGGAGQVDARVAETYREYLESVLPEAEPEWVSFFCYSDRDNWYDAMSGPQYRRADGSAHRPGLLDAGLRRKPAYDAVAAALRRSCSSSSGR